MNCRQWEERIALGEGDPEVERHLESCVACREFAMDLQQSLRLLWKAHQESLTDAPMAAVRARVLDRVQSRRLWWPVWVGGVATAVVLLALWVAPGTRVPQRNPRPAPSIAVAPVPNQPSVASRPEPKRVARAHRVRKPPPPPATETLVVKLITDDPDVVIYWIVDPKGD
jgi:hypothetical protein